jgi:hypothetical protein
MSTSSQALVKRIVGLASLAVLAASLGLVLVACGSDHPVSASQPPTGSSSGSWRTLPSAPVRAEAGVTSVWTGDEMIVVGTHPGPDGTFIGTTDLAAAYDPVTRAWRRLPTPPKTENYCHRGAVWTGREMLFWGSGLLGFDPLNDRWQRLPQPPAGMGIAVWTGHELIGWGGGCCGDASSDGAAYSPATGAWRKLAPSPLAPEQGALGVWTGRELLVFVSGINPADGKPWPARLARAAAYDPSTDSWRRLAPIPDLGVRFGGTATWDGHEMLVVGAGARARSTLAYDPAANRWRRLASPPVGRLDARAVWTGSRLLVWGSETASSASPVGLAYEPRSDRWSRLPRVPLHGLGQTVVWTGHDLLVWGGVVPTPAGTKAPVRYLNTGVVFTPAPERSAQ